MAVGKILAAGRLSAGDGRCERGTFIRPEENAERDEVPRKPVLDFRSGSDSAPTFAAVTDCLEAMGGPGSRTEDPSSVEEMGRLRRASESAYWRGCRNHRGI